MAGGRTVWSALQALQAGDAHQGLCQTRGVAVQTEGTIGPLCLGPDLPPSISKLTEFLKQSLHLCAF